MINTPLGPMVAIGDEEFLYRLDFSYSDQPLPRTASVISIQKEIEEYFAGRLHTFKTPFKMNGTLFQQTVWAKLREIPYGKTCSYRDIAREIGKPQAARAVGGAIGANPLMLIVPCHRVIQSDGSLGGYNSGLPRKEWLLKHEL